jgi:hypothetical protein
LHSHLSDLYTPGKSAYPQPETTLQEGISGLMTNAGICPVSLCKAPGAVPARKRYPCTSPVYPESSGRAAGARTWGVIRARVRAAGCHQPARSGYPRGKPPPEGLRRVGLQSGCARTPPGLEPARPRRNRLRHIHAPVCVTRRSATLPQLTMVNRLSVVN